MKLYLTYIALICCLFIGKTSRAQSNVLVTKVLAQLKIELAQCNEEFIREEQLPYNKNLSVVVIPKYNEKEDDYFTLDSYILLVNNKTGKIISKYFEDADSNGWTSDAVMLERIDIETNPYKIKAGVNAFAIIVGFRGSSNPNPYSNELISIFEPKGAELRCVLKNFESETYGGEWDMHCAGKFKEEQKTLSFAKTTTLGYYDIVVKSKIRNITSVKVKEDCIEKVSTKTAIKVLKFKNGTYR